MRGAAVGGNDPVDLVELLDDRLHLRIKSRVAHICVLVRVFTEGSQKLFVVGEDSDAHWCVSVGYPAL
ncbi:hypothetical protein D3C76_1674740 [compost metagenome]